MAESNRAVQKHIVLITSGQPATNPRVVKEADTFQANGYEVTVLHCYWNRWASLADKELMRTREWKLIRVAGDPFKRVLEYYTSKLLQQAAKYCTLIWFKNRLGIYALSRATFPLLRAAMQIPADMYLAHNLAALPAAVEAAKLHLAVAGFDAEDYHREETKICPNDLNFRLKVMLEDLYIPQLDYFTASSNSIAGLYYNQYQRAATVIRNLLPVVQQPINRTGGLTPRTLKLFWFSQTIGPDRGLETVIMALRYLEPATYELHLLGAQKPGYLRQLRVLATANDIPMYNIHFHEPASPAELVKHCARYDVGLASEPAHCGNNDAALSNKLFTYIQAGLAVLLSDTKAQKAFYDQHPEIGKCYQRNSEQALAKAIQHYIDHDQELQDTKRRNYQLGQQSLNWETESQHLLNKIKLTLN